MLASLARLKICIFPGVFREKQRIEPEFAWSPRQNLEERAFILVGVFNLDPGYAYGIERSWRDLTGARTIYHHLYNQHDLCRILFLERTNKTPDIGKYQLKNSSTKIEKKYILKFQICLRTWYWWNVAVSILVIAKKCWILYKGCV